jgi:hypothetical protein
LEPLLVCVERRLVDYNEAALRSIASLLGLDDARFVRASELGVDDTGTRRLVALVKAAGGDSYLAGAGADGYQEDDLFAQAGLALVRQSFDEPRYEGPDGQAIAGLSAVDALMSLGSGGAARLLGVS